MRNRLGILLVAACATALASDPVPKVGYVDCSPPADKDRLAPIFSNPRTAQRVGSLSCGQTVKILGREGPYFKIASDDAGDRYISVTLVSQEKDRFLPLDIPSPSAASPNCSVFRAKTGKVPPHLIYSRDPEYSPQARKAGVQGTVTLTLTIGTDGLAHNVKVLKSLGHDLDESAVRAVQSWKWEPALENGTAIEAKVAIEISFHR